MSNEVVWKRQEVVGSEGVSTLSGCSDFPVEERRGVREFLRENLDNLPNSGKRIFLLL